MSLPDIWEHTQVLPYTKFGFGDFLILTENYIAIHPDIIHLIPVRNSSYL